MNIKSIWDNSGKTIDRYTIFFKDTENMVLGTDGDGGSSFSQWGKGIEGAHLGERINFDKLEKNIQDHIIKRCKGQL